MKKLFVVLMLLLVISGCSKKKEIVNLDYYGEIAQRASMEIHNSEEDPNTYEVMISWSDSAFEHEVWNFTIDTLEGTANYNDCTKTDVIFEESDAKEAVDGYIEKDEILYKDMSGSLTFDKENKKVTWHSDVADDSANMEDVVFVLSE